jgi:hypothetical protein
MVVILREDKKSFIVRLEQDACELTNDLNILRLISRDWLGESPLTVDATLM